MFVLNTSGALTVRLYYVALTVNITLFKCICILTGIFILYFFVDHAFGKCIPNYNNGEGEYT